MIGGARRRTVVGCQALRLSLKSDSGPAQRRERDDFLSVDFLQYLGADFSDHSVQCDRAGDLHFGECSGILSPAEAVIKIRRERAGKEVAVWVLSRGQVDDAHIQPETM